MNSSVLIEGDVHFSFGENWRAFLESVDTASIVEAEESLQRLLGRRSLEGLSFLDIGSGSGLFSLAARRLGARVHSFDCDPDSVECARTLKGLYFPDDDSWKVEQGSVLDPNYMSGLDTFDIVYSWGVLHHTGAMHDALRAAAMCVSRSGLFAFALYRKTLLCRIWTVEKQYYASASRRAQWLLRSVFKALLRLKFMFTHEKFESYVKNYKSKRGMNFDCDLHDWMGGFPYESISPEEVSGLMAALGFKPVRSFTQRFSIGVFGAGCSEYCYCR